MYWMQVNENRALVEREKGDDFPGVKIVEDIGFVLLVGEEEEVSKLVSQACLTVSDEGEGEPELH